MAATTKLANKPMCIGADKARHESGERRCGIGRDCECGVGSGVGKLVVELAES